MPPFNAADLKNARANLQSASRDTPLVEKFIAMRNFNIGFGAAHPGGTLDPADVVLLDSLCKRSSPDVQVTGRRHASTFGGGSSVEMVFKTRFKAHVTPAPPIRVIRFVRAAQVNRNFISTKEEYTVPGYVRYELGKERKTKADPTPDYVLTALKRSFLSAQWAFDGPREEFRHGSLNNEDTPGTKSSDLPYAIAAEFLIVLYDEAKKMILEVGHVTGSYVVWKDGRTSFVLGPPTLLVAPI